MKCQWVSGSTDIIIGIILAPSSHNHQSATFGVTSSYECDGYFQYQKRWVSPKNNGIHGTSRIQSTTAQWNCSPSNLNDTNAPGQKLWRWIRWLATTKSSRTCRTYVSLPKTDCITKGKTVFEMIQRIQTVYVASNEFYMCTEEYHARIIPMVYVLPPTWAI